MLTTEPQGNRLFSPLYHRNPPRVLDDLRHKTHSTWNHLRLLQPLHCLHHPPPFLFSIILANTPPSPRRPSISQHPLRSTLRFLSTLKPKSWMESLFFIPLDCRMEEGGGRREGDRRSASPTLSLSLSLLHSQLSSLSLSLILSLQVRTWTSRTFFFLEKRSRLVWKLRRVSDSERFSICCVFLTCITCSFLLCYCPFDQGHFVLFT